MQCVYRLFIFFSIQHNHLPFSNRLFHIRMEQKVCGSLGQNGRRSTIEHHGSHVNGHTNQDTIRRLRRHAGVRSQVSDGPLQGGLGVSMHQVLVLTQEIKFRRTEVAVLLLTVGYGLMIFGLLLPKELVLDAPQANDVIGEQAAFVALNGGILQQERRPDINTGLAAIVITGCGFYLFFQSLTVQSKVLEGVADEQVVVGGNGRGRVGFDIVAGLGALQLQEEIAAVLAVVHCLLRDMGMLESDRRCVAGSSFYKLIPVVNR